jgi:hypothetical protein
VSNADSVSQDPRRTYRWQQLRDRLVRNATTCAICGYPLQDAPPRSRYSPSVDHIVPVALGGAPFALDNLRVIHYGCNSIRGNRQPKLRRRRRRRPPAAIGRPHGGDLDHDRTSLRAAVDQLFSEVVVSVDPDGYTPTRRLRNGGRSGVGGQIRWEAQVLGNSPVALDFRLRLDVLAQSDVDADGPQVALALGENQSTSVAPLRRNHARSSR